MKDLIERILKLREEISDMKRAENTIKNERLKKEDVLEELEKLTVNQLVLFEQ